MVLSYLMRTAVVSSIILASGGWVDGFEYMPPAVETAKKATVVIALPGSEDGTEPSPAWSGFFISPDGMLLTYAESISPCHSTGGGPALSVILGSDTDGKVTIPASIVACDRERSLALLQVQHQPNSWLSTLSSQDLRPQDRIWAVGVSAPGGSEGGGDGVATLAGSVISLKRNDQMKVLAIELDIEAGDGFAGGPVLDLNGDVVGVVMIDGTGDSRVVGAVSPNLLYEFSRALEVRVAFSSKRVRSPIEVKAEPLLIKLGAATGTMTVTGSDIDPIKLSLESNGNIWRTTIPPIERIQGRPVAEVYAVNLRFVAEDGTTVFDRHYRLNNDSKNPPAEIREKPITADTRLSEIADRYKLALQDDAVIDHDALSWYRSALARTYPPSRYEELEKFEHEELATVYDLAKHGVEIARGKMPLSQKYLDDFLRTVEDNSRELRKLDIAFCIDNQKWVYRDKTDCKNLTEPSL